MLQAEFTPLEIDEDSLAFGAHEEVGHGGHFLGAMHTMERFRTCFYRPMLSSSDNYERWMRNGGLDTNARATKIYQAEARGVRRPAARRRHPPGAPGVRRPPPRASSATRPPPGPCPPRFHWVPCESGAPPAVATAGASVQ